MAAASSRSFSLCVLLLLLLLAPPISASFLFDGGKSKSAAAAAAVDMEWRPATATWYGDAEGDGSTGGACGYGSLVDVVPMKARVGSVSPVLFKDGEGCGACYKVKCLDHGICSRRAVTVIVTDECPGGLCAFGRTHFDLSGAAFSRMAVAGAGGHLRDRGQLSVVYRSAVFKYTRTACKYGGKNIAFRVNEGSTNFWLSLLVEFEDGQGDIGSMQIKQANSVEWLDMKHVWGATWCLVRGPLVGPFSVRLTTLSAQKALTARDVIPRNWKPTATYTSRLNFEAAL
uniref:Expansin-like EG45 domain-containing protein n=1 Tax=Oryza glumipatula TaxID=40148 RepID=A0A0D9ZNE7_9ORYZ